MNYINIIEKLLNFKSSSLLIFANILLLLIILLLLFNYAKMKKSTQDKQIENEKKTIEGLRRIDKERETFRKGLEKNIECLHEIFEIKTISDFNSKVLELLVSIIYFDNNKPDCQIDSFFASKKNGEFKIVESTGKYKNDYKRKLEMVIPNRIMEDIDRTLNEKRNLYFDNYFIVYFKSKSGMENIIFMENLEVFHQIDKDLIEVFTRNIAIAFDNIQLNREIEKTQIEVIFTLGEISEAKSKETGNHIKRVAEYTKLLASKYGLTEEETETLKLASPMHDVGKIGIPDSILNKPGKLTKEEFEIIKTHTTLGYDILKSSHRKIMKTAAIVAYEHHEKYDGTGYPRGIKGEEIHIYGRILALVDVFDALGSNRVYKRAWNLEEILELIKEERGNHFDPKLVDIFFDNLEEFIKIRDKFTDEKETVNY